MEEWFRTFFDKLYYETYRPREPEERNEEEAKFIAKVLDLPRGSKVLDVGCGYARHAVYLARMGYRVVGVDLSDYLLEIARERIKRFNVEVELVKKDMRKLDYMEEFDGAYMFFTTFGYFTHEENQEVLRRIASVLKHRGRLLIDIGNKYQIIHRFVVRGDVESYTWWESGGYIILERRRFDMNEEMITAERIFIKDGALVGRRELMIRLYSYRELKFMLEKAGMKLIEAYGDYQSNAFKINSPRLIVVAQKCLC